MCTPWTKKDLIRMSPETELFKHIDSLALPEYINIELWEQKNFFSAAKMESMCKWNRGKFIDWYNEGI
jgi:hypothetical protein